MRQSWFTKLAPIVKGELMTRQQAVFSPTEASSLGPVMLLFLPADGACCLL